MRLRYFIALLAMSVSTAFGAQTEDITFTSRKWDVAKQEIVTEQVTKSCIIIEGQNDEWLGLGEKEKTTYYAVRGEVKRKTLNCFGIVHLVLLDNAHLTCTGGIKVERPVAIELNIHAQSDGANKGRLTVTNSYKEAAGIGSAEDVSCADVLFHGGSTNVVGGKYAAGIGSGALYDREQNIDGEVYVFAGDLTVQGGYKAAGIGSGSAWGKYQNNSGELYVYGGTVKATGGYMGAGVGGGGGRDQIGNWAHRSGSSGAKVVVYGGKLIAKGGYRAAGIGGGSTIPARNRGGGSLKVFGGEVTATGGEYGAGIGGGCNGSGASVEISGGIVRAQGGKNSAGIGGGEDGETGHCRISGGKVTAIIGENCAGREAGKGSAIGSGKGKDKYKPEHLEIADHLMVRAGDSETNIERTFTTPERAAACQWRNVAIIEACTHEGATYVIIDGEKHRRNCTYCADNHDELHDFGQAGNRHDCVCGQKFDSETTVLTLTRYFYTYDGSQPSIKSATEKVARGKGYILPAPPAINGLIFKGYSTTATATGEMLDSEEGTLIAAGQVSPTDNTTYYARYRYDFQPEWTWNEECTEASVKITNDLLNGSETLTATCQLVEDQKPADNQWGRMTYKATATYNRKAGITYTFTDEQVLDYHNLTEITLDAYDDDNETVMEQYKDRQAVVTIRNLTLQKDGKLHSLCLPFTAQIKGSPLEGATIYSETGETIVNGQLQMTFQPVSGEWIAAGEPYFVKWPQGTDIEHPTFSGVYIGDGSQYVADQYYELGGTFDAMAFDDGDKVFALEDSELKPLDYNNAPAFTNYLFIPFEKTADGDVAVTSVRLTFEGDITVEAAVYDEWEGEGTAESPYLILTPQQLQKMSAAFNASDANVRGKYFRQEANITFDKTQENNFTPVKNFMGQYDGNGHVIRGLNINVTSPNEAGLFFDMEAGSTIKNVTVANSTLKGSTAAAIASAVTSASTVTDCHVLKDVTIEGETSAGGIVGVLNRSNAIVTFCTSQATVRGYSGVGGIVGVVTSGQVYSSIGLGSSVTGSNNVGAVVGYRRSGTMADCYYTVPTMSDDRAKLMPMEKEDNAHFLALLVRRDNLLLNGGLTEEQIGYDLTMNGRTLTATQQTDGTWKSRAYTVSLPFDMAIPTEQHEDVKVYKLHEVDIDNQVFQFTNDFPILKAGEPYVVVIGKGSLTLAGTNVLAVAERTAPSPVYNADASQLMGHWCATLRKYSNDEAIAERAYILQKDGMFKIVSKKYSYVTMIPFRAYFSASEDLPVRDFTVKYIPTENGEESGTVTDFPADEFESDGEMDDASGIATVHSSQTADDSYYDLHGRRLNGKPAKGVYIHNGRKEIR